MHIYLIECWRWRLGGRGLGVGHLSTLVGDGAEPAPLLGGMVAMVTKQATLWIQNVLKEGRMMSSVQIPPPKKQNTQHIYNE